MKDMKLTLFLVIGLMLKSLGLLLQMEIPKELLKIIVIVLVVLKQYSRIKNPMVFV